VVAVVVDVPFFVLTYLGRQVCKSSIDGLIRVTILTACAHSPSFGHMRYQGEIKETVAVFVEMRVHLDGM
jgi:hypothetical protein